MCFSYASLNTTEQITFLFLQNDSTCDNVTPRKLDLMGGFASSREVKNELPIFLVPCQNVPGVSVLELLLHLVTCMLHHAVLHLHPYQDAGLSLGTQSA